MMITTRQKEIIILIARGYCRKEIAKELEVTAQTVDYHINGNSMPTHAKSIKEVLGTDNIAWLTQFAIFTGWVQLGDCKK